MPVPELLPPNAGKDELEKVVLGAAGCAGGKLLVALAPPKALLPPKPPNAFAPPFAGAGAEAPKLKPFCCGAPKFALCDRPFARVLANAIFLLCVSRCLAGLKRFADMLALRYERGTEA